MTRELRPPKSNEITPRELDLVKAYMRMRFTELTPPDEPTKKHLLKIAEGMMRNNLIRDFHMAQVVKLHIRSQRDFNPEPYLIPAAKKLSTYLMYFFKPSQPAKSNYGWYALEDAILTELGYSRGARQLAADIESGAIKVPPAFMPAKEDSKGFPAPKVIISESGVFTARTNSPAIAFHNALTVLREVGLERPVSLRTFATHLETPYELLFALEKAVEPTRVPNHEAVIRKALNALGVETSSHIPLADMMQRACTRAAALVKLNNIDLSLLSSAPAIKHEGRF